MTVRYRRQLARSVFRQTGRNPLWLGYWLRRHRCTEGLGTAALAAKLQLDPEGLVLLSLCSTPRPEQFRDDLDVVCRRTGAERTALAQLLRQEQSLACWAERPVPAQGWLMAASDAPPRSAEEEAGPGEREPP